MGMRFDLILLYTVPGGWGIGDSELRSRLKPDAWNKQVKSLALEETTS